MTGQQRALLLLALVAAMLVLLKLAEGVPAVFPFPAAP